MLIALIARDKDGALQVRKDNRTAHLAYIDATSVVLHAGPLSLCSVQNRQVISNVIF